jgi:glycosidase
MKKHWLHAGLRGFTALGIAMALAVGCAPAPAPKAGIPADVYAPKDMFGIKHPDWMKDAVIYQINTRQFTPEGTFKAAQAQLPRLQALGVDVLWLMPIHPIGEKNRKGTLGSPYSVKDYYGVNPEFGTEDDFRAFVAEAQKLGMKVILDWVANHTAWDNPMAAEHPDWYTRNWKGEFHSTDWTDWADIIDLDYSQPGLRAYMTAAMVYWVKDMGVDGFRCDVAHFVPLDFWQQVRKELDAIKPVFMLAEAQTRDMHYAAFNATYSWQWNDGMHRIGKGQAGVGAVTGFYAENDWTFPRQAMRMIHVANHDQNSWDSVARDRFGPATDAAIVLSFVGEGLPMMYNGQEAGDPKRLAFFERDPIPWRKDRMEDLYRNLIALKSTNEALWNAPWGGEMAQVVNNKPQQVFSFVRQAGKDKVFAVFNLSPRPQTVTFTDGPYAGAYKEHFSGASMQFDANTQLALPAWSYRVYLARVDAPSEPAPSQPKK